MNNRITSLFQSKKKNILSVYFTAGYPALDDTTTIISELDKNGVDLIEIGIPFSDPLADGPIIQQSGQKAIHNGMTISYLFNELKDTRNHTKIPLILMGYLNPILQFGVKAFCETCSRIGIDGLIIPDLPPDYYKLHFQDLFKEHNLCNIMLITPQTDDDRIKEIDSLSSGFIYMVSTNSITGANKTLEQQLPYFERVAKMKLKNPTLVGFGIHDRQTYQIATKYSNGAIIGSAFIKALKKSNLLDKPISDFVGRVGR